MRNYYLGLVGFASLQSEQARRLPLQADLTQLSPPRIVGIDPIDEFLADGLGPFLSSDCIICSMSSKFHARVIFDLASKPESPLPVLTYWLPDE